MKKILVLIFSFIIMFGCGGIALSSTTFADEAQPQIQEVGSASNFVDALKNESNYESNVIIRLTHDIDLKEQDLDDIAKVDKSFQGTFDGNGFSISNPSFVSAKNYYGIIPKAQNATIKNLRVCGDIEFKMDESSLNDVYAGVIVGFAKNCKIENCEVDNSDSTEGAVINLSVKANLYFGSIAGKVENSMENKKDAIDNCVNFYDVKIELNRETNVLVGGIAGSAQNCHILNALNYGNITLENNATDLSKNDPIKLGGIVGELTGSETPYVRNACFMGEVNSQNDDGLNLVKGAIIGGGDKNLTNKNNVNFDYYTSNNLSLSGDNFLSETNKLKRVDVIDSEFLNGANGNMDPSNPPFDFDKIWNLVNSRFHLQHFQTFNFTFNQQIDSREIESISFAEDSDLKEMNAKYGSKVTVFLKIKEQYYKYYVLLNSGIERIQPGVEEKRIDNGLYTITEETATDEGSEISYVTGYKIEIEANAVTGGTYSFVLSPKDYHCIIGLSEDAKTNLNGGIIIDKGGNPGFDDVPLTFYLNSNPKEITAVGQGIYTFDHWDLFYRSSNGEYNQLIEDFEESGASSLNIVFGTAPFDREFKIVAYFTNEGAIKVDFSQFQNNASIKAIKFSGIDYSGEPILVSPKAKSVPLDITLKRGYTLDTNEFLKSLYGENTENMLVSTPNIDEDGNKTYHFAVNMLNIENIENKSLSLSFMISEDKSGNANSLLWLYITLPIVVVLAVVIVLIIVLRRRKMKGGTGNKKPEKKESYKDYY